jgi:hypothetical protein
MGENETSLEGAKQRGGISKREKIMSEIYSPLRGSERIQHTMGEF